MEPADAISAKQEVLFEAAAARASGKVNDKTPVVPMVLMGHVAELDVYDEPIRESWLIGLIEAGDGPSAARAIICLGQADRRTKPRWQVFYGHEGLSHWRYMGRFMVYGPLSPDALAGGMAGPQTLAVCVRTDANRGAYQKGLDLLARQLTSFKSQNMDSPELDQALSHVRSLRDKSAPKPAKPEKPAKQPRPKKQQQKRNPPES